MRIQIVDLRPGEAHQRRALPDGWRPVPGGVYFDPDNQSVRLAILVDDRAEICQEIFHVLADGQDVEELVPDDDLAPLGACPRGVVFLKIYPEKPVRKIGRPD